ncbi:hypothetical protein [Streptomyces sp. NPDC048606]|uniref:hypothetical protein n=1 Tax=Streptomyces sp. NPDC048606 TaxID=3154726 RepID=UPI0034478FB6
MAGVSSFSDTFSRAARGALTGLLAAFTALAVAKLVAGLVRPATGPVTVVGGAVTDRTRAVVKDFAISTFGENDKAVLRLGILMVLADLARQAGVDTWRQWSYPWQATPGGHTITVRATDGTRTVQTEQRTRTIPDGASGRHSVFVTVPQTTGTA